MIRRTRLALLVAGALVVALVGAACTSDSNGASSASAAASGGPLDLKGVCPNPLVFQADWQPESEQGFLYNLVGPGYTPDTNKKRVTGPLIAHGQDTGIQIQIRTGGPAVGFDPVPSVMYTDPSIHLGFVATDEGVQFAPKQPTTAVFTQMDISPLALIWDPAQHPDFHTVVDVGQSDATVFYTNGLAYMEYLVGSGILRRNQLNASYDGSPAAFVQSKGKAVIQGFATSEPYLYEKEIKQWGKPLRFSLINDSGYPEYFSAVSIRAGDKAKLASCLKKLVPILQQSQVDFIAKPDHGIQVILDLVKKYNTSWQYSPGLAQYSAKALKDVGIAGNGTNKTLGDFDMNRVQKIIDIVTPILAGQKRPVKQGLKPADIATNEFIDTKIGMPSS